MLAFNTRMCDLICKIFFFFFIFQMSSNIYKGIMNLCVSITQLHPFSTHSPYMQSPVLFNSKHLLSHRFCGSAIWIDSCWMSLAQHLSYASVSEAAVVEPQCHSAWLGSCGVRSFSELAQVCVRGQPRRPDWGPLSTACGLSVILCSCSHISILITENPIYTFHLYIFQHVPPRQGFLKKKNTALIPLFTQKSE